MNVVLVAHRSTVLAGVKGRFAIADATAYGRP
jgi:hypothetical protein